MTLEQDVTTDRRKKPVLTDFVANPGRPTGPQTPLLEQKLCFLWAKTRRSCLKQAKSSLLWSITESARIRLSDEQSSHPLEQVRLTGLEALSRVLGPVGLVRFLQQFETGYGDYTAERHRWLGEHTVQGLAQEIERQSASDFVQHRQPVFDAWNVPDSRVVTA